MDDQAPRFARFAVRRAVGLAALAGALAALGCTKSPLGWALDFAPPLTVAGKAAPGAAASASPTPAGTPRPAESATAAPGDAASTGPASPTPAPEPSDAIGPDDPLPAASTSSDLAPAETTAVEQALASEEVLPYFDLVHDGGVVLLTHDGGVALFRTMATGSGDVKRQAATTPLQPGPAPLWGRTEEAHSAEILTLRRQCADGDCEEGKRPVRATIHYQQKGEFAFKGPDGVVKKRYGALFSRTALLVPQGGKYQLGAIGPATVSTKGGRRGLEVAVVHVFRAGTFAAATPPYLRLEPAEKPLKLTEVPKALGGEKIRLEIDLQARGPGAPFVFAAVAGGQAAGRVQLFDDGRGVDRTAGDGRYSGEIAMPNKPGLQHVLIDAVAPGSFLPNLPFQAYTLGLPFDVQVREGG